MNEAKSDQITYMRAMTQGHYSICSAIEKKYDLYGYPPQVVSVGLAAAVQGADARQAADDYVSGGAS